MVKESWDLGIPLFSNQRIDMAGPGLLGIKIKNGRKIFRPLPVNYRPFLYHLKIILTI